MEEKTAEGLDLIFEKFELLMYALDHAPTWMCHLFLLARTEEKRMRRAERLIKWAREHGGKGN